MKDEKGSSAAVDMNTSLPEGKRARTGQVDSESGFERLSEGDKAHQGMV